MWWFAIDWIPHSQLRCSFSNALSWLNETILHCIYQVTGHKHICFFGAFWKQIWASNAFLSPCFDHEILQPFCLFTCPCAHEFVFWWWSWTFQMRSHIRFKKGCAQNHFEEFIIDQLICRIRPMVFNWYCFCELAKTITVYFRANHPIWFPYSPLTWRGIPMASLSSFTVRSCASMM